MKKNLIILLSLFLSICASAQKSLDLLTISGRYGFPQAYDSVISNKATETGLMISLSAPVVLSKNTIWYNNITYFNWDVSNDAVLPAEIQNPISLHGFILRTGLIQKFSNDRSLQLLFSPRLMSDLQNTNANSFQFGGLAMYEKKFKENLTMSFGVLYNQELFGPYLVPLINLDWKLSQKWSIVGLLPIYAKIKYQATEKLSVGISHFGLVTTYYLGDPSYKGDYIERQSIDLGLFGRYRIAGNFYVEGRFGHSFGRSYRQYEGDQKVDFAIPLVKFGDERVQKNVIFKDGLIANIRLIYNIPIPEDE